jgi:uncharacterized membrane-anchored protein
MTERWAARTTTARAPPRTVESVTHDQEEHMTRDFDMRIPLISTGVALALTAYSTLKPPRSSEATRETLIELVIVAVVAGVTFLLTRRAISRSQNPPSGRAALVLAVVGLASVLAFFLGIFSVALAGAAMMIALEARQRRSSPRAATAAIVISVVTIALSVLIAIVS